jgi:hypothetical protein
VPPGGGRILLNSWRGLLFDEFLFKQNLAMVEEVVRRGDPILNYVFTVYGHMPFELDTHYQPLVINGEGADDNLLRIANQTFYRTRALASYVEHLRMIDPDGLIVVLSDHLPPLPGGVAAYHSLGYLPEISGSSAQGVYETMLIVLDRGVPERIDPVCHFEVPRLVLNKLSNGKYCEVNGGCEPDCLRQPAKPARYSEAYKTIIGLGARPWLESRLPDTR